MALKPIFLSNLKSHTHFSIFPSIVSFNPFHLTPTSVNTHNNTANRSNISRRLGVGLIALMASSVAVMVPVEVANGFDVKLVAPDQSLEEAERGIRSHAEALLEVKDLIEIKSWKEAQKSVRRSAGMLRGDIHTIIQYKPAAERPTLRKLYSFLFNNVTRLDYAARDKDAERVWQCYNNMVMAVSDILSRI